MVWSLSAETGSHCADDAVALVLKPVRVLGGLGSLSLQSLLQAKSSRHNTS